MNLGELTRMAIDGVRNRLGTQQIRYIVDAKPWAVSTIGRSLIRELNQLPDISSSLTTTHLGSRRALLHFGSPYLFWWRGRMIAPHPSNRTIVTIFHQAQGDERLRELASRTDIQLFHTTCTITRDRLLTWGLRSESLKIIPPGIDPRPFACVQQLGKTLARQRLNLPEDAFIVGSFQKDGLGWGRGPEPKPEKGPDVLVATLRSFQGKLPLFVLLLGPARGYVEQQLSQAGIPFRSLGWLGRREQVVACYATLDAYLITSRVEGGPLQLLEAWEAGVPVVSTDVGIVHDVATHEKNVLVATLEDSFALSNHLLRLAADQALGKRLSQQGKITVKKYYWAHVAQQYLHELYRPLLAKA